MAAVAADPTVVGAQGTSLKLAGDKWEEIVDGESIPDGRVFRTLRSGRVLLGVEGNFIRLAGNTAVQVDVTDGAAMVIHLYAGSVDVEAHLGGRRISVATSVILASGEQAGYSVRVGDQTATVRAISGVVVVTDILRNRSTAIEAGREVAASLSGAGRTGVPGSSGKADLPGSAPEGVPGQGEASGLGGPPGGGSKGGGKPISGNGPSGGSSHGAAGGHGGGNGTDNGNGGAGASGFAGENGNAAKNKGGGNGNGN